MRILFEPILGDIFFDEAERKVFMETQGEGEVRVIGLSECKG